VVDTGSETLLEVLLDDLAGDRADILVADAGIVPALRSRITLFGETKRAAVFIEEILLLKPEPGTVVVEDGCAFVGRMRGLAIGHHDLAQHQHAVGARRVREDPDRLEDAVGTAAFRLHRRASVKAPEWKFV